MYSPPGYKPTMTPEEVDKLLGSLASRKVGPAGLKGSIGPEGSIGPHLAPEEAAKILGDLETYRPPEPSRGSHLFPLIVVCAIAYLIFYYLTH